MRVLIATESRADDRKTLAAVRVLGSFGAEVTVGGDRLDRPVFRSRFCRRSITYPSPAVDQCGFVQSLRRHLELHPYDVLLPLSDHVTIPVIHSKAELEKLVRIPVADIHAHTRAHDKLEALRIAEELGIGVPVTHHPNTLEELRDVAREVAYPCIVKPRKGAGGVGFRILASADELLREGDALTRAGDLVYDYRPLVQEYIPGEVHDVCLLFNRGEPRAALTQRRLRMYPASGGVGIYNETTRDPALQDQAVALLRALHWHGPALVEFKRDERDGTPKLMEINARFWGTLDLSIQAGVDFPGLACRMAIEGDIEPAFDYAVGMRYRWPIPYAAWVSAETNRRWHTMWEFWRPQRNCRSDVWLSDPLPHMATLGFGARPG